MQTISKTDANALLAYWVHMLHLEEWDICFRHKVDPKRMALSESSGCASYNEVCRQAVIEIADFDLYEKDMPFEVDFEQVLVHELLHLKFAILYDTGNEMQDRNAHILIDQLARALVRVKRGDEAC